MVQVGLTDNVPVHVLGGSIVPIGAAGSSSTAAALRAPLTLLVALPRRGAGATPLQRCMPACAASQVVRRISSKLMYKRKWNRRETDSRMAVWLTAPPCARLAGKGRAGQCTWTVATSCCPDRTLIIMPHLRLCRCMPLCLVIADIGWVWQSSCTKIHIKPCNRRADAATSWCALWARLVRMQARPA